jgi:hypothetical protein
MFVKEFSISNSSLLVIKFVTEQSDTYFTWPVDYVFTEVIQDGTYHIGFRYQNGSEVPYRLIFQDGNVQLFHEKKKPTEPYFEERMNFKAKFEWKWELFTTLNMEATYALRDPEEIVIMKYANSKPGLWIEKRIDLVETV